uniref:Uncharacterized protein n=1 Tax=Cajanus cajan TaxID=3821 RepID=A0A151RWZ0_CAJCA|nr:hypothetical protein KK1_031299 [Cajanus cajan]
MLTSILVWLFVLVAVCFKSSMFVDSLSPILHSNPNKGDSKFEIDIHVLAISIANDLPPSSTKLYFLGDFQRSQIEIPRGEAYIRLLDFNIHSGLVKWVKCTDFSVYDPSREGGHERIFYSIREDGVYHSWDNKNWDRREVWDYYC